MPAGGTLQPFPISHQPTAQPEINPYIEKSSFQVPTRSSPPPVHALSQFGGTHSPPPPSSTTHGSMAPSPPPQSPQYNGTFHGGSLADISGSLNPLRRPSPSYPAAGNPNLLSTYRPSVAIPAPSVPPTDEGKMSVSIDFGKLRVASTYFVQLWINRYVLGTTFSGVVSISLFWRVASNRHACHRRTVLLALLPEKCNKFYIGQGQWRPLGRFRLVCCTMSVDKFLRGVWRRKTPTQFRDLSSVNGTTW